MDIRWAAEQLDAGKAVRRQSWKPVDARLECGDAGFVWMGPGAGLGEVVLRPADLLADDWEPVG